MSDPTEEIRREMVKEINSDPRSREALEEKHGKGNVWDTEELQKEFKVKGFMAPFCMVERKSDGKVGVVEFQHHPRFYYGFNVG